jgi:hypothetical protein
MNFKRNFKRFEKSEERRIKIKIPSKVEGYEPEEGLRAKELILKV